MSQRSNDCFDGGNRKCEHNKHNRMRRYRHCARTTNWVSRRSSSRLRCGDGRCIRNELRSIFGRGDAVDDRRSIAAVSAAKQSLSNVGDGRSSVLSMLRRSDVVSEQEAEADYLRGKEVASDAGM